MDIKVIASGSSGNCYLVSDGKTKFLLDCGIPIKRIQKASGYRLSDYSFCLLTHEHGDHSKAAKDLLRYGLNVYSGHGTLEALGISSYNAKPVKAREMFSEGSLDIIPLEAEHDAAEPLNYYIASKVTGDRLAYITDTYYMRYKLDGLTQILLEINYDEDTLQENQGINALPYAKRVWKSHMGLETAFEFLKANDLSKLREIYVIHISNQNGNEKKIKDTIQQVTGVPVIMT